MASYPSSPLPDDFLIDANETFVDNLDEPVIHRCQEITDYHMQWLRDQQEEHRWNLNGMTKLCEVPQAVADRWMAEGFNIFEADARSIIERLRKEEFDLFITSGSKRY